MVSGGVAVGPAFDVEGVVEVFDVVDVECGDEQSAFVELVVDVEVFAVLAQPALVDVPANGVGGIGHLEHVGFVGDVPDAEACVRAAVAEARAEEGDLSAGVWAGGVVDDLRIVDVEIGLNGLLRGAGG